MFKLLRYIDWSELSGLLVGAVLAIAICISIFILVAKLQQEGIIGKKEYSLYCDMVSAQGLRKGTTVQINGVDIGRVEDITLTEKGFVRLKLTINTKYRQWITDRSVVYATRDQNIISERVVNVDISQKSDRILEDEEFLIAGTAQDIETVLKTANELIDKIGLLVVAADTLLKMVVDTNASIGMLLGSRILYNNLDHAVTRLNKLLVDADGLFKTVNGGIPKAMAFADTLSGGVMGLMGNLDNLTGRALNLVNSLDTTMYNFGNMVSDLNSLVGPAGNIITDGSQTINKADDFIGGISKSWLFRSNIPKKDSVPLLGGETW